MQFEIIMQKLTQIFVVLASGTIYMLNQMDITIIEKAFDQLFSLGLLVIICVVLYRERKNAQDYNEKRDKRFEELVENNTKAMKEMKDEIRIIHGRIDDNERRIKRRVNNE